MKFGYARVSTREQSLALQLDVLRQQGREKIFQERGGSAKANRTQLARLLEEVREGDVIVIWKL